MRLSGEAVFVACDNTGAIRGVFSEQGHAEAYLRKSLSSQPTTSGKGTVRIWVIDEPQAFEAD